MFWALSISLSFVLTIRLWRCWPGLKPLMIGFPLCVRMKPSSSFLILLFSSDSCDHSTVSGFPLDYSFFAIPPIWPGRRPALNAAASSLLRKRPSKVSSVVFYPSWTSPSYPDMFKLEVSAPIGTPCLCGALPSSVRLVKWVLMLPRILEAVF